MQRVLPHGVDTFGKWLRQSKAKHLCNILSQKSGTPLILPYVIFCYLPSRGSQKTNWLMNIVIDYLVYDVRNDAKVGAIQLGFKIMCH